MCQNDVKIYETWPKAMYNLIGLKDDSRLQLVRDLRWKAFTISMVSEVVACWIIRTEVICGSSVRVLVVN